MPLSQTIIDIINGIGADFAPDSKREEYDLYRETWDLYLSLYEMDRTRIAALIQAHGGEDEERLKQRKELAAIFNYVPSILGMVVNYLHAEQPVIAVDNDVLKTFLDNADGSGNGYVRYVKQTVLPLALVFGFVDVLVQRPAAPDGMFVTVADEQAAAASAGAACFTITPLQRTDWSVTTSGEYQWIRFVDLDDESPNPFAPRGATAEIYITITRYLHFFDAQGTEYAFRDEQGNEVGFWLRSWKESPAASSAGAGGPGTITDTGTAIENMKATGWLHDGDWLPMRRVPIATMYYVKSVDYRRRHFGISKISMIAILTVKIIQLLSWTDEDILSNLALFVFPGDKPKDKDGNPVEVKLDPWSAIWTGNNAQFAPTIVQGATSHIDVKLKLIDAYIREILRLAYMIGASAQAEQITSGVQGVVARNELFMELSDLAGGLDSFTLDVLTLVVNWQGGKYSAMTREEMISEFKPTVSYYKGPYAVDPLSVVIANCQSLIDVFDRISPEMQMQAYRQLAQAALYNEDAARDTVFAEIEQNFAVVQAERDQLAAEAEAASAAGAIPPAGGAAPAPAPGEVPTPSIANGGADAGNAVGLPGEGANTNFVGPGKIPKTGQN